MRINQKIMRNLLFAIAISLIVTGCQQSGGTRPSPDSTLEAFYQNLCSGEFNLAEGLCDREAMKGYMDSFRSAWERNDSTIRTITTDILADISIEITETEQKGQNRTIFYKLTAIDGQTKEKIATLKKEEGEWKITAITDRH